MKWRRSNRAESRWYKRRCALCKCRRQAIRDVEGSWCYYHLVLSIQAGMEKGWTGGKD